LNGEGLLSVVFFGLGLRVEENDRWIVVMGVAFVMTGEGLGVSLEFMGVAKFGD
jgi:hypothetical protein